MACNSSPPTFTNYDCCGCNEASVKQYPSLAKIYMGIGGIDYYKSFCNVQDLITECLSTPDGLLSSDQRLYQRGKDIMVKRCVDSSICYHRVATMIIDEYCIIRDFEFVECNAWDNLYPVKFKCEELAELAELLNN